MITRLKGILKRVVKNAFSSAGLEVRRASRVKARARKKKPSPFRRESPENLYDAVSFLRKTAVDEINRELQQRIGAEVRDGRTLRVAFVVSDRTKWNADSLLEEMRGAGWSTRLYLGLNRVRFADRNDRIGNYLRERDFFKRIDGDLVDLYDWEGDDELRVEETIEADIVFLQQPWGMSDYPRRLMGRSLSVYMHYGFILMANHGQHYHMDPFHSYLWRYFAQTEAHRLLHLSHDPYAHNRLVVTGYPKLDVYLSEAYDRSSAVWPDPGPDSRRIVYAPHHSIGAGSLGMSTFTWTHKFMLALARDTPNTQWVYKPHPNLKYKVARNKVMTREEYVRYEEAWSKLPNATVYDSGQYFDIFRSSDALITDCGSFLAEYLPTGMPIIWLVSPASVGFNTIGASLSEAFYEVRSTSELRETFQKVVMDGNDPLKDERSRAVQRLFPTGGRAATAIVEHLRQQFLVDPAN